MDLVLDIGNSGIKGGLFRNGDLAGSFRIDGARTENDRRGTDRTGTDRSASVSRLQDAIQGAIRRGLEERSEAPIRRCGILSVVPELTAPVEDALTGAISELEVPPLRLRADHGGPVQPAYASMDTLGIDRYAAACGGYLRAGRGPLLVADAGTAITTEVVDPEGRYVGGSITAGPDLVLEALSRETAQLTPISLEERPRPIGRTTGESLRTGILYGAVDALEGAVRRCEAEFGEAPAVYLTGGWARRLGALTEISHQVHPHLVLEGGRALLEAQTGATSPGRE